MITIIGTGKSKHFRKGLEAKVGEEQAALLVKTGRATIKGAKAPKAEEPKQEAKAPVEQPKAKKKTKKANK